MAYFKRSRTKKVYRSKRLNALKVGDFNPSDFKKFLSNLDSSIWNKDKYRLQWRGQEDTQSILVKYNTENPLDLFKKQEDQFPKVKEQLLPFFKKMEELVPDREVFRTIITKLPKQRSIGLHVDPKEYQQLIRFHWTIQTNEKCEMIFRKEKFHFKEGEIWYFNNLVLHAVKNVGNTDRIHVIVDFKK